MGSRCQVQWHFEPHFIVIKDGKIAKKYIDYMHLLTKKSDVVLKKLKRLDKKRFSV